MERLRYEERETSSSPILRNLKQKRDLLASADPRHETLKTALILDGGGMRGVYAGGVVSGLEAAGMRETFDLVIGVSSGAAAGAYFLSGQAELGTTIYYEDLASKRFINPLRLGKMLDIDYLDDVFRNTKSLNQEAVKKSRSDFYIGVTEPKTGRGRMIDAKKPDIDIITAIRASSALPIAYNRTVSLVDEEFVDGIAGCGLPINFALDQGYNNLLVVLNQTYENKSDHISRVEKLFSGLYMRKSSPELRTAYLTRNQLYNQGLTAIREQRGSESISIGVVSPDSMTLSRLCRDSGQMQKVAQAAKQQTQALFT